MASYTANSEISIWCELLSSVQKLPSCKQSLIFRLVTSLAPLKCQTWLNADQIHMIKPVFCLWSSTVYRHQKVRQANSLLEMYYSACVFYEVWNRSGCAFLLLPWLPGKCTDHVTTGGKPVNQSSFWLIVSFSSLSLTLKCGQVDVCVGLCVCVFWWTAQQGLGGWHILPKGWKKLQRHKNEGLDQRYDGREGERGMERGKRCFQTSLWVSWWFFYVSLTVLLKLLVSKQLWLTIYAGSNWFIASLVLVVYLVNQYFLSGGAKLFVLPFS